MISQPPLIEGKQVDAFIAGNDEGGSQTVFSRQGRLQSNCCTSQSNKLILCAQTSGYKKLKYSH
jgi:hypothetical protein